MLLLHISLCVCLGLFFIFFCFRCCCFLFSLLAQQNGYLFFQATALLILGLVYTYTYTYKNTGVHTHVFIRQERQRKQQHSIDSIIQLSLFLPLCISLPYFISAWIMAAARNANSFTKYMLSPFVYTNLMNTHIEIRACIADRWPLFVCMCVSAGRCGGIVLRNEYQYEYFCSFTYLQFLTANCCWSFSSNSRVIFYSSVFVATLLAVAFKMEKENCSWLNQKVKG